MTNGELIKRFFLGRIRGDEESYGFSVKPRLMGDVGKFFLFSKMNQFPMASKISENYYIVAASSTGNPAGRWKKHIELVAMVAKSLGIDFVLSPNADKARFQKYMESRINITLAALATNLRTGTYQRTYKHTNIDLIEPEFDLVSESKPPHVFPANYLRLMENIQTLLDGEIRLGLSKNQVTLLDTEEVQGLWRWLIKENQDKKDRELLRKMYVLSRLLAPKGGE